MKIKDFFKNHKYGILRIVITTLLTICILCAIISCSKGAKADTIQTTDKVGDETYLVSGYDNLNQYKSNSYIVPVSQARKIAFFITANMGSYVFANTQFQVSFVDYENGAITNTNNMLWWFRYGSSTQTIRNPGQPNASNVALYNTGLTFNDSLVQVGSTSNMYKYLNVVQYNQTSVSSVNITSTWDYILITFPSSYGSPNPLYAPSMIYSPRKSLFLTDGVIELPNTTQQQALNFMNISISTLENIYQQGITHGYDLGLDYYKNEIEPPRLANEYTRGYDTAKTELQDNYNISFSWFLSLFGALSQIFAIKIFGDLSLGAIVIIPFGITFVWFIIKSLTGGNS